jgi:hypothetical protein
LRLNKVLKKVRVFGPKESEVTINLHISLIFSRVVKRVGYTAKENLPLCLINWAPNHENVWGSGGIAPPFLTSTQIWGEWSASLPAHFTTQERVPSAHWIGDWVDPKSSLDAMEKIKTPPPAGNPTPGRPNRNYTYWAIPVVGHTEKYEIWRNEKRVIILVKISWKEFLWKS